MGVKVSYKIGGTINCPHCGKIIDLSEKKNPETQKSTSNIQKKIDKFKKDIRKIFESLIKLTFLGFVIYVVYYLISK